MAKKNKEQLPLHTESVKKKYIEVERIVKRKMTELLLLSNVGEEGYSSRWLSINSDFSLRVLTEEENNKFKVNLANIKDGTLENTEKKIVDELFDIIERKVDDEAIASCYKKGVYDFVYTTIRNARIPALKRDISYQKFISQYHDLYKSDKKEDIAKFNVLAQVGRILFKKFWEKAFIVTIDEETWKERLELSDSCRDYFHSLFFKANQVWRSRWKNIDQVFHDWDFPFISENLKATNDEYLEVINYLVSRDKYNLFWKRWTEGNQERAKKTSQYADILWALTDKNIKIEKPDLIKQYGWDETTEKLFKNGGNFLQRLVENHNTYKKKKGSSSFILSQRLKSLSSSVEKIIEGKTINDAIWFRISMEDANAEYFQDIKELSKEWVKDLATNLKNHPENYLEAGNTLKIKEIIIDNKGVLEKGQMKSFINELSSIVPTEERKKAESPFIDENERIKNMKENYNEDYKNSDRRNTFLAFFQQFSDGKTRWKNWGYKDFKLNVFVEIFNDTKEPIWERIIEVQFDDINNSADFANFNIRNCERSVNTQSNLSLDIPLTQVRKITETNLKKMAYRSKGKDEKFQTLHFIEDNGSVNLSDLYFRTRGNSSDLNKAIIEIINYFIKKGTFMLYRKVSSEWEKIDLNLDRWGLSLKNLEEGEIEKISICSALEVAKQQYSYLENRENDEIWIYIPDEEKIRRAPLGEIVDRMNLWKKRKSEILP